MTDARARELLRQEREAFDQAKAHHARWFMLRLVMCYAGIGFFFAIALVLGYLLLHPANYPPAMIAVASTALFVDLVGLVISIFKLVLQQGSVVPLKPVIEVHPDRH